MPVTYAQQVFAVIVRAKSTPLFTHRASAYMTNTPEKAKVSRATTFPLLCSVCTSYRVSLLPLIALTALG